MRHLPKWIKEADPYRILWMRLRRDRIAMASFLFIVFLIVLAIFAPLVIEILGLPGPNTQNLNLTDSFGSPLGPTSAHLLWLLQPKQIMD